MDLRDFVTETLKQVIDGVVASQEYAKSKGATINPVGLKYNQGVLAEGLQVDTGRRPLIPQIIEFDVALTVTEGGQAKSGIGIFVGAVGVGTQAQLGAENSMVSRVKFSVPVMFPQQALE